MELRIQPFPKNNFPKKGLLIKGASPLVWLYEMEVLKIDLTQVESYPIPSHEPNVLYGCLLIFSHLAPQEIGKNAYFQCVDDKLFIPENTNVYPKINPEDWVHTDARLMVMHPEFGFVKLSEQIDWISLIQEPEKTDVEIRKPLHGVKIPQTIESYTVEIDDEKVLEALQKSKTEEEWMKNLPFDLKKVLAGNKKEIEKYLKYIEKYPDRAVDLGVPLDIMGTSRGDGLGKFTFDKGWFGSLFGGNNSEGTESKSRRNFRWIFWGAIIVAIIGRLALSKERNNTSEDKVTQSSGKVIIGEVKEESDILAFQSGLTEIDQKIDSIYWKDRQELSNEYVKAGNAIIENKKEKDKYAGRSLQEVKKEIEKNTAKEKNSRDSLKAFYKKKIASQVEGKTEHLRRRLSDSLKQYSYGKPVKGDVVKYLLHKKTVLMADSLERLYGTMDELETPPAPIKDIKSNDHNSSEEKPKSETAFSDIIFLVLFIIGAIGIYSYVFRKQALDIGGDTIPGWMKIILVSIIIVMLIYLFYPLIKMFGYNWFVWAIVLCVLFVLYRLFSEDKSILKDDKNE